MTWAKIDDQFHSHPKLAFLGSMMLPCVGLHVLALSWSAQYLTNGKIPSGQVHRLAGDIDLLLSSGNAVTTLAQRLVDVGLWEDLGDGLYQIHDYLAYNPSRETVLKERKGTLERLNRLRSARKALASGNANSNAVTNAVTTPAPVPVPGTTFGSTNYPPTGPPSVKNDNVNSDKVQDTADETSAEPSAPDALADARALVAFVNHVTGRTYRETSEHLHLVDARLREGWSVQDCKTMIVRKWRDWHTDARMAPYIRPSTLFNRAKLETYMAELGFRPSAR